MTTAIDLRPPRIPTAVSQSHPCPSTAAYHRALTRYASCLHATTSMLRDNESDTDEELRHRELAGAARRREVDHALELVRRTRQQCVRVRTEYGLGSLADPPDPIEGEPIGSWPSDPPLAAAPATTEMPAPDLAASMEELRLHQAELADACVNFDRWRARTDQRSERAVTMAAVVAGLMVGIALTLASGAGRFAVNPIVTVLLGTAVVVASAIVVATSRRLPSVCRGPALARVPDVSRMASTATWMAAPVSGGLTVIELFAA